MRDATLHTKVDCLCAYFLTGPIICTVISECALKGQKSYTKVILMLCEAIILESCLRGSQLQATYT